MGHHELISAPAQRLHVGERGVEELLVEVGRHQAASDPEEPAAPAKLGSLSPPSVTDNSARLSWTPVTTFDSYLLQYRVQGSGETHNVTLPGGKRGYLIVGLLPSTTYTVYIYGITGTKHTQPLTTHITTAGSESKVAKMPGDLGTLSVSHLMPQSFKLAWTAARGFDSFLVEYRAAGVGAVRSLTVPAARSFSFVRGLSPATVYTVHVYGLAGEQRSKPLTTQVTTTVAVDTNGVRPSRLSKLIRLSGNNVTDSSVQVYWAAERGFDTFLIQYGVEGAAEAQNLTVTGDQHSAFISGLRPGTRYLLSLYGVAGKRRTRPLTTVVTTAASVRVDQVKSILFGGLTFSDITANSLRLSWEADDAFESFLIQYVAQGSTSRSNLTLGPGRRSAQVTGLLPATNYTIYLYGVSEGKLSRPLVARLTITAVPVYDTLVSTLGGLLVSDISARGMRLAWTVEDGAFDSFLVRYRDSMARLASRELTVPGNSHHVSITELSPSTEYHLSLHGVLDGRQTDPIPITARTARESPSGLRFTKVTESSVTISWTGSSDRADSYKIFYVQTKQGEPRSRSVDGTRTDVALSGLAPGARYEVNLVPVRGGVESPPILGHFTTAPDPPSQLKAVNVSYSRALLQWKAAVVPVNHYVVSYKAEGAAPVVKTLPADSAEIHLTGLWANTVYTVTVHGQQGARSSTKDSARFTTLPGRIPFPKDCSEELSNGRTDSGEAILYLNGNKAKPIKVFCDMTTDGGGWIVFQRRMNGKVNFMRTWKEYVSGFGDITAEHWLGLDKLHQLTSQGRLELRVDLRADEQTAYATYDSFAVEDQEARFRLGLGKYSGTAGNSLSYHRGSNFTTMDVDNDNALTNCAVSYRGGWWYQNCHRVNLNGEYANNKDHQGVNWFSWKGFEFSIPFTEMKFRPWASELSARRE